MIAFTLRTLAAGLLLLLLLWAFLSYLQPWFTGERLTDLLICS